MAENGKPHALKNAAERFEDIAKDLFNIEVNVILRDNITAQKMPSPRHALLDIGKEYYTALKEMEFNYRYYLQSQGKEVPGYEGTLFDAKRQDLGYYTPGELVHKDVAADDYRQLVNPNISEQLGGFGALDVIRTWANYFIDDLEKEQYLNHLQLAVLPRIKENADLLKGLLSTLCRHDESLKNEGLLVELEKIPQELLTPNTIVNVCKRLNPSRTRELTNEFARSDLVNDLGISPLPLSDYKLVVIRKVWELGIEVIAMQTIVQVDGDVITRLNPNFMDEKRFPRLRDYHNESVQMALQHWGELVNVAKELVLSMARGVSDRLSS